MTRCIMMSIVLTTVCAAQLHGQTTPKLQIATNGFEEAYIGYRPLGTDSTLLIVASHATIRVEARNYTFGKGGPAVIWGLAGVHADGSLTAKVGPGAEIRTSVDGQLRLELKSPLAPDLVSVNFSLTVPDQIKTIHIQTGTGDVTVTGFDGDLIIESDSGQVHGTLLGGGVAIEARNGAVEVGLMNTAAPHAISILARNGGVTLNTPKRESGVPDLVFGCAATSDPRVREGALDQKSSAGRVVDAMGIVQARSGCQLTTDARPLKSSAQSQSFTGQWVKGGAAISIRTIRGGILLRAN